MSPGEFFSSLLVKPGGGSGPGRLNQLTSSLSEPLLSKSRRWIPSTRHSAIANERLRSCDRCQGFERLCQRLLRESGFQQVRVTGRSGDGGIDGTGVLQVNPFVSFKVLFQCKRWANAVGPNVVRDFRGAMMGRADKGLILTTGVFTPDAQAEAVRDGASPIELVDGEKLVTLLEQLELGLTARTTYDVDLKFFDEFGA